MRDWLPLTAGELAEGPEHAEKGAARLSALELERSGAPQVAWVGITESGAATVFRNLVQVASGDSRIRTLTLPLEPGNILNGKIWNWRMRGLHRALHLFRLREVDVVWTAYTAPIFPWLLTARAWRRTPVVYSIDATLKQLHDWGPLYGYFGGRTRARFAARNRMERLLLRRMTLLTPRSEWCARSMREDYGIPAERIRVLPPGVDLDLWRPSRAPVPGKSLPRGIFVGVDFERKGGDLLLEVFRRRFRGRLELDLVTRGDVPEEPGVRVHTGLAPNDPQLLELYRRADLLVLPTRAENFGVSAVEGLACGLPVILGRTGGTSEVLEEGVQGYYVEPGDGEALAAALEGMISRPALRQQMGQAGRSLAERRYDVRTITTRLIGWMLELADRPPGGDSPPSTRP